MKESYVSYIICLQVTISVIDCVMLIYVQSNEYSELCKCCNLSAQQSIAAIKYCLYRQFCGKGTGN